MFQDAELTVREYLDILRRRRWFIASVTLVIAALATIPVALQTPVYASSSTIQLRSSESLSVFPEESGESETTRNRALITDLGILITDETRALVVDRLGPDGLPFDDVRPELQGFSEIIRITVTAPTAIGAQEAANAYADVYVELRREASTSALATQETELRSQIQELRRRQTEVEAQLGAADLSPIALENLRQERGLLTSQISDYERRADEMAVDAQLRREAFEVSSRAPLELTPIAPKPFRSLVIGTAIGLLVGICVALLLEIVRDRVASSTEMAAIDPDITILATVPHVDVDLDDPTQQLPSSAAEAYRYLWTAIRFRSLDSPIRSLLVTSSLSGEGKTTTAVNLAISLSEAGSRVVLIDADLRKSAIHERLGVANEHGLASIVAGQSSVADALRFVRPNLAVMTAGHPTSAATDILGDDRFVRMVKALEEQCDLVIIDAPPVLPVADALLAARSVGRTLLVGRIGTVRRRELKSTIARLKGARLPILGLVANDEEAGPSYDRYSTYYGSDEEGGVRADA